MRGQPTPAAAVPGIGAPGGERVAAALALDVMDHRLPWVRRPIGTRPGRFLRPVAGVRARVVARPTRFEGFGVPRSPVGTVTTGQKRRYLV